MSDCTRIDMVEADNKCSGSNQRGWGAVVDGNRSDMAQMSTRALKQHRWGAYVDVGALTLTR